MTRLGVVPLSEAMVHVSIHDVVVWPLLRSKVDLRATRSASMPLALRARAPAASLRTSCVRIRRRPVEQRLIWQAALRAAGGWVEAEREGA